MNTKGRSRLGRWSMAIMVGAVVSAPACGVTEVSLVIATILQPTTGAVFQEGEAVLFLGNAAVEKGGEPVSGAGTKMEWESSIDGDLGEGASLTVPGLTPGKHFITLTASAGDGTATGTDTATIVVQAAVLDIEITSPTTGSNFASGAPVTFTGTAEHSINGPITGADLVWTSDLEGGTIGTGGSFVRDDLGVGAHVITLTAPDPSGGTASTSVSIDVTPPPPGGLIAFSSDRDGDEEIYSIDAGGSGPLRLTTDANRDQDPSWSPSGTRIAFSSDRDSGLDDVFLMNADGSAQTNLTNNAAAEDDDPDWGPNGLILFRSQRDGNREIYVVADTGGVQTNLTNHPSEDEAAVWSPDGSMIAFVSDRDGDEEIFVMNADGTGVTQLTTNFIEEEEPSWSPDGTTIAFSRAGDIWLMDADGSNQREIVDHGGWEDQPVWSPDGLWLAFRSTQSGNDDLYIVRSDGSGTPQPVTTDAGDDSDPSWR